MKSFQVDSITEVLSHAAETRGITVLKVSGDLGRFSFASPTLFLTRQVDGSDESTMRTITEFVSRCFSSSNSAVIVVEKDTGIRLRRSCDAYLSTEDGRVFHVEKDRGEQWEPAHWEAFESMDHVDRQRRVATCDARRPFARVSEFPHSCEAAE